MRTDKVDILLVDDQPAKLLSYEVILEELGENLLKANSAREALEQLLRNDVGVILIDVCMPDLDGFQLAAMVRDHPRFAKTSIIFVSAVHFTDVDRLRGYEMGAVDYVPVPVIPEVLRAKVRIFAELFRKTRQLEQLNRELETRVVARTAELQASTERLTQSEQLRSLALAAGQMGSWDFDVISGRCDWDEGQYRIFGVEPERFVVSVETVSGLIHPEDWQRLYAAWQALNEETKSLQTEFRVRRPNGDLRWCIGTAAASFDGNHRVVRVSGVTIDITDRKQTEERQALLAREVDHRARNALAVVQSIVRLTKADTVQDYGVAIEGRIGALSRAHMLLSQSRWQGANLRGLIDEELAPYRGGEIEKILAEGPDVVLQPAIAQTLTLALHELATNAAKYGALSTASGRVRVSWVLSGAGTTLQWLEQGGPPVQPPVARGYGTRVISASVERQLGGSARFDWRSEGLTCTLSIPLGDPHNLRDGASGNRRDHDREHSVAAARKLSGNRILLVEDEALVAMMMADVLVKLGFAVVGPCASAAEAVATARDQEVDGAILDVNLGGEMVYPVADFLEARNIPFVFVTGYGAESVDRRFAEVPLLQKPVDHTVLQNLFVVTTHDRPVARAPRRSERVASVAGGPHDQGGS